MKSDRWKVRWEHHQHSYSPHKMDGFFTYKSKEPPQKSYTVCKIEQDGTFYEGKSYCNPKENYCKITGRYASFKRAVEGIGNPLLREELWLAYGKQWPKYIKK